jgi:2-oxoglutarate ferredoxin oxidoreductase subunit gamma
MKLTEARIAGFGGQGVILAANIIGKAAALFGGGYATLTQNYGPEARGGACSAQLVLSDEPILYPYTTQPEILIVMSQEAFTRFAPEMSPAGMLLVEQDLVRIGDLPAGIRVFSIPATRLAEELGKKMVLNVIMVGFFAARSGLLPKEAYLKAVAESVPAHAKEVNLRAFETGYAYGSELLEGAEGVLTEQAVVE